MRTILLITIFACFVGLTGCGDAAFLAKEGLIPAAQETVHNASAMSGVRVTVQSNFLAEAATSDRIVFSGMEPGRTFIYIQFDNSTQVRTVGADETIAFNVPKNSLVTVTYLFTGKGSGKEFTLPSVDDYRWNNSTKTFHHVTRRR